MQLAHSIVLLLLLVGLFSLQLAIGIQAEFDQVYASEFALVGDIGDPLLVKHSPLQLRLLTRIQDIHDSK